MALHLRYGLQRLSAACLFLSRYVVSVMADVIEGAQQEFWRAPAVLAEAVPVAATAEGEQFAEVCIGCGREFMIGAKFCHACGLSRPANNLKSTLAAGSEAAIVAGLWLKNVARTRSSFLRAASFWRAIPLPSLVALSALP